MIRTCTIVPSEVMLECPECERVLPKRDFTSPVVIQRRAGSCNWLHDYTIAVCPGCNEFVIISCTVVR